MDIFLELIYLVYGRLSYPSHFEISNRFQVQFCVIRKEMTSLKPASIPKKRLLGSIGQPPTVVGVKSRCKISLWGNHSYFLIAFRYLVNSLFTTGNKKNNPTILGNTIAKIIASEKSQIDFILAEAPMITKVKNNNL